MGKRLFTALNEVVADLRGEKPLPELSSIPTEVDVRAVRRRTGLSQARFSARFGIKLRTLQDWEQGRCRPDTTARALLMIIDRDPLAVVRALKAD
jgi:putative transcriptional regulator